MARWWRLAQQKTSATPSSFDPQRKESEFVLTLICVAIHLLRKTMLSRLRDVWTMFRIAGYSDTVGLWRHSRTLASSVRNHIVLDVLIALEKCGLLAQLGTQHGVTPALAGFDPVQLEAALEYLTVAEILEQIGSGRFRAR